MVLLWWFWTKFRNIQEQHWTEKKGQEPPKVPHFTKKELYKSVKPRVMMSSNHPVAILYIEVVFDDHSTFGFHYPLCEHFFLSRIASPTHSWICI